MRPTSSPRSRKDLGALTVGVITKPFSFEGVRRKLVAEQFSELLKEKCDTFITIPNDRLREVVDKKTASWMHSASSTTCCARACRGSAT